MSAAFKSFVAGLFGKEECSDCVVRFSLSKDAADRSEAQPMENETAAEQPEDARTAEEAGVAEEDAPMAAATIGEPLPAHSWVLRPGSSFFGSQLERWVKEQPVGAKVLHVPLGREEDVGHSLAAIRYIYTGELDVSAAADLLGMRRLACYLGVEGATEACNAALLSIVKVKAKAPSIAGVLELFSCRQLIPAWDDDPTAAALVDGLGAACQQKLVAYKGTDTEFSAPGGTAAKVSLGELLAWAFPDAPSVLSDPGASGRVRALSASCLEALLSSDALATDNEASVLLLLAEWLDAHPGTADDVRRKLCGCIRLCQLSDVYLHGVLPGLQWVPLSKPELGLLFQAVKMRAGKGLERLLAHVADCGYTWPQAWTSGAARPGRRADAGRPYEWSIASSDLGTELGKLTESTTVASEVKRGENAAGIFLNCDLPASVKSCALRVGLMDPGMCRLAVRRAVAGNDNAGLAFAYNYGKEQDLIPVGRGWGFPKALALAEVPSPLDGAAPDPLARWAPYLREGKLSGTLEWRSA